MGWTGSWLQGETGPGVQNRQISPVWVVGVRPVGREAEGLGGKEVRPYVQS